MILESFWKGWILCSRSYPDILRLASVSKCSAYDCEFVALAHSLGVPLVTSDAEILDSFPSIAVSPKDFVS
jgi:predicted nucleic acid-binding protein